MQYLAEGGEGIIKGHYGDWHHFHGGPKVTPYFQIANIFLLNFIKITVAPETRVIKILRVLASITLFTQYVM